MSTYSFTGKQLAKKVGPKKPFWTKRKIIVTSSLGFLSLFITLIASAPSTPVVEVASNTSTETTPVSTVESKPQTSSIDYNKYIQSHDYGYSCVNVNNGTEFVTGDYQACLEHVQAYQCTFDGTIYNTTSKSACDVKLKELQEKNHREFNALQHAEDYKNALDNLSYQTRNQK